MLDIEPITERKDDRLQCRHIMPSGLRCQSPCLRTRALATPSQPAYEAFCFHHFQSHHRAERQRPEPTSGPDSAFPLPEIEDRTSVRIALNEILTRIATNQLDPRRAGLLLYGLQTAALCLPPQPSAASRNSRPHSHMEEETPTVVDVVLHPTFGMVGPIAPYAEPDDQRPSLGHRLIDLLDQKKAKQAAHRKALEDAQAQAEQEARQQAEQQTKVQAEQQPEAAAPPSEAEPTPMNESTTEPTIESTTEPTILSSLEARAEDESAGAPSSTGSSSRVGRKPLTARAVAVVLAVEIGPGFSPDITRPATDRALAPVTHQSALRGRRPLRGEYWASRGPTRWSAQDPVATNGSTP